MASPNHPKAYPCVALIAATTAFAAATASDRGPLDGELRLRHGAYAEIAAAPSRIDALRQRADAMHLPIDCSKMAGRFGTIRIGLPKGTSEADIDGLAAVLSDPDRGSRPAGFKMQMVYAGMRRTRGACVDLRPVPMPPGASLASEIQLMGMERQLQPIRAFAAAHGWKITCEGRAGEERVLRIGFPRHADAAIIDGFFRPAHPRASSWRSFYPGQRVPKSCDMEEPLSGEAGGEGIRRIAIGPQASLTKLAALARECGFANAHIRALSDGDLPSRPPAFRSDWMTLDAGEDAALRYGPLTCFAQLHREVLAGRGTPPDANSDR